MVEKLEELAISLANKFFLAGFLLSGFSNMIAPGGILEYRRCEQGTATYHISNIATVVPYVVCHPIDALTDFNPINKEYFE
ncbi:hypothetical protein J4423_05665 [Candidatus Pacearchaeota archaeon]|nr:hypothetical protein [Candidatus Pacearchaeota archaeon]